MAQNDNQFFHLFNQYPKIFFQAKVKSRTVKNIVYSAVEISTQALTEEQAKELKKAIIELEFAAVQEKKKIHIFHYNPKDGADFVNHLKKWQQQYKDIIQKAKTEGALAGFFSDNLPYDIAGYIAPFITDEKDSAALSSASKKAWEASKEHQQYAEEKIIKSFEALGETSGSQTAQQLSNDNSVMPSNYQQISKLEFLENLKEILNDPKWDLVSKSHNPFSLFKAKDPVQKLRKKLKSLNSKGINTDELFKDVVKLIRNIKISQKETIDRKELYQTLKKQASFLQLKESKVTKKPT